MPLDWSTIQPNTLWIHKKGGLYLVLGLVRSSTNGRENEPEEVLYYSFAHKTYNRREVSEFMDGRFKPIDSLPIAKFTLEHAVEG